VREVTFPIYRGHTCAWKPEVLAPASRISSMFSRWPFRPSAIRTQIARKSLWPRVNDTLIDCGRFLFEEFRDGRAQGFPKSLLAADMRCHSSVVRLARGRSSAPAIGVAL